MTSPSAQWRALESADAGTTPLSRRPRLLSKRGVTSTRCHKTAIDVTIDRLKLNSLAQYSVGVPRSRLAQARRRRRPSTRSQRLRRPARRRGRADRPATHSPPQYTWTKPACPHCAPASPSSKVEVWGGLLVPADSAEKGTPQGRWRQPSWHRMTLALSRSMRHNDHHVQDGHEDGSTRGRGECRGR
jgi:hypothetical protein